MSHKMNVKKNPKCPRDTSSGDQSTDGETMTSTDYELPFQKNLSVVQQDEELPNVENDFIRAKAYLMKQCLSGGDNLWDHLNEVLEKILVERPKNIGSTFEEFSYKVRHCRFQSKTNHLFDIYTPPRHFPLSQRLMKILKPFDDDNLPEKTEGEDDENQAECDLMEMFYCFEQGGVALPKEELFCIGMDLRKLASAFPVEQFRFWGKILGTKRNYYIAETELREEEIVRLNMEREAEDERIRLEKEEKEAAEELEAKLRSDALLEELNERERKYETERNEAKYAAMVKEAKAKGLTKMPEREMIAPWPAIPPLPGVSVSKPLECPSEPTGVGVNKKTYFVSHQPGDEWIQLPDVTPQEIVAARKIKRAFTGDLESDVITFPPFPGKEKNLLRAQIARISAGTQISPLGYFTFNEEEEEEEEMESGVEGKTKYIMNPDFEPVALRDLIDPSMAFWVHHSPYILQQGRTTWWNPAQRPRNEEEEEVAEEEENVEKEVGPPLLTPLSEDSTMDAVVPWSVRKTSFLYPAHSIAIVRSNLWPGAYAFASDKKFDNVYIGDGNKFSASNHSPIILLEVPEEYQDGPEIMEMLDPTPEIEETWRIAHAEKKDSQSVAEDNDEVERDDGDTDDEDV